MNSNQQVDDLNVEQQQTLLPPCQLKQEVPGTVRTQTVVSESRAAVRNILERRDHRLLVVVGPCSIHDVAAARDYAGRLAELAKEVQDSLFLVMRVYFEKPRTSIGWKGFINDPCLDNSFQVEKGLRLARTLLRDLLEMGLATATEVLDPVTPQYLQDLITWSVIGARTAESQTHREIASGLSSPSGFKNGTDGNLATAINALRSSRRPHRFLGINHQGQVAVIHTKGNPHGHLVLRGGGGEPNYSPQQVADCESAMTKAGLEPNIMVDCSHANSGGDPDRQPLVLSSVARQLLAGNRSITGVMMESNIHAGKQPIVQSPEQLKYGISVTDACMDWESTRQSLLELSSRTAAVLRERAGGALPGRLAS